MEVTLGATWISLAIEQGQFKARHPADLFHIVSIRGGDRLLLRLLRARQVTHFPVHFADILQEMRRSYMLAAGDCQAFFVTSQSFRQIQDGIVREGVSGIVRRARYQAPIARLPSIGNRFVELVQRLLEIPLVSPVPKSTLRMNFSDQGKV